MKSKYYNLGLFAAIFLIKGGGLYFDQFRFSCEGTPSQYKKIIEPLKNRGGIYYAVF